MEHEDLDEDRTRLYEDQYESHKNEYEDSIRTLEAYLRREQKAQDRLLESIRRQQEEKDRLEAEIRRIRKSVEKVDTAIARARTSPRSQPVDPDLFGIAARRVKAMEMASQAQARLPSVRDQLRAQWREKAASSASPETTAVKQRLQEVQDKSSRQDEDFNPREPQLRGAKQGFETRCRLAHEADSQRQEEGLRTLPAWDTVWTCPQWGEHEVVKQVDVKPRRQDKW